MLAIKAATTTLENELCLRILGHLASATVSQLRQILQLFEDQPRTKLSPFRFLDLPRDLREYIAERFFTQSDAAKVLTVNRTFSELFTKSIWRNIELTGVTLRGREVPHSLFKCGRLVRQLAIRSIAPYFHMPGYFPTVQHVSFTLCSGTTDMFAVNLEYMSNLRRVTMTITGESAGHAGTAANWINNQGRSGHVLLIHLSASHDTNNWRSIHASLATLLGSVTNTKRIRLDLATLEVLPTEIAPLLPQVLVSLDICQVKPDRCHGKLNKQVFGGEEAPVFPHLCKLRLQACCNNPADYDFSTFKPDRFPVLTDISIGCRAASCSEQSQLPLATIFANQPWPSITTLKFFGQSTPVPDLHLYLKAMPNIQICHLVKMADFKLDFITAELKCVQQLNIDGGNCSSDQAFYPLPQLKKLMISNMVFGGASFPQIIAMSPRLTSVEFTHCSMRSAAVDLLKGIDAPQVKHLKINESRANDDLKIDPAIGIFSNLEVLDIRNVVNERKLGMLKYCPNPTILI
ncbi:hypothetical protein GQ42DRAFT_89594 [Ramicandelaber brevisporus]|nr:hypothetical protein GQ42DRAFT_89594 [Ramicandelaber brevisporus]